jgi:hypothetical protein
MAAKKAAIFLLRYNPLSKTSWNKKVSGSNPAAGCPIDFNKSARGIEEHGFKIAKRDACEGQVKSFRTYYFRTY